MRRKFIPRNTLKSNNNQPKSLTGLIPKGELFQTFNDCIPVTSAQFIKLVDNNNLVFPAIYKITDIQNGLYVNTYSKTEYSKYNLLSLNCPKTYETTTLDGNVWKGIWRSSKTANINDLFIWGGVVWKNKTGNIGTSVDIVTLDAVNWEYIDRNNFNNNEYIPLSLICYYDFEQSWINYLQDEHTNIIGVDWHLNQIYGLTYNPSTSCDWNAVSKSGIVFTNNQLFLVANNLGNVISNKTNGFIYNNDGNVFDNKYCTVIANNEQDVYENIAATHDIDGAINEVFYLNGSSFYFTHDFSVSPLTSGSSVYYNLIPTGARLTNCTTIPNSLIGGGGATLRVGLETDDISYGLAATALGSITNTVVNTVSNAATANRSIQLTAGTNNITGGSVTIKVEFVL